MSIKLKSRRFAAAAVTVCLAVGLALAMAFRIAPGNNTPEKKWLPDNALNRFKHPHRVLCVAFTPDSKTLLCGTHDLRDGSSQERNPPSLWGWDVKTGEKRFAFAAHDGRVISLAVSPDGGTAATVGDASLVRFWDLARQTETRSIAGDVLGSYSVAYSASGKLLAAVSENTVRMWDISTGKQLHVWDWPKACTVAFSPDEKILACLDLGGVLFWDTSSGKRLHEPELHGGNGISLSFSPDGQLLATGGNGPVQFLNVQLGVECGRIDLRIPQITYSPNGRMLATGGIADGRLDCTVRLWEIATGKERARFHGHENWVHGLAFSADGRLLASTSEDCTAIIWDLAARIKTPAPSTDEQYLALWDSLESTDASAAYDAICQMTSAGPDAVAHLQKHIQKALTGKTPRTPREIGQWIKNLGNDAAAERTKAVAQLESQGMAVLPLLARSLEKRPSREVSGQVELLLRFLPKQSDFVKSKPMSAANLQLLRGLEVLENIGTLSARALVKTLSETAPDLRVALEAEAVLGRMHQAR